MKKILIRVESHSKSGIGGLETRIKEFCKKLNLNFTFLTNSKFLIETNYLNGKNIYTNYFNIFGILKDIFSFRNYYFIDSNGLRDNLISSLNFLIFLPFYKLKKTKLFLTIHGNQGILEMSGFKKFVYNFIFKIGLLISDKIIVVSEELKDFLIKNYKISDKKVEIILNFIEIKNNLIKKNIEKKQKALIISRLDDNKINGILKTIDFCLKNNISLDIYGNGKNLEILKEKYKNKENIFFLGFKKQEEINYENYTLIFAMGRAILEGIANNLDAVLIGYNDLICEINTKNYEKIKYSNFSGRGVSKEKIDFKNIQKNKKEILKKIKNDFNLENLKDFYK